MEKTFKVGDLVRVKERQFYHSKDGAACGASYPETMRGDLIISELHGKRNLFASVLCADGNERCVERASDLEMAE